MTSQDISGSADTNLVRYPYRRGANVVGADGQMVGTLEQIVVDRDSGVLLGLIVRSASGMREFELPENCVSRNEGDTVHLSVRADELATHPELARPYDPQEYLPVSPGEIASHDQPSRIALETGQPVVASVGHSAADVVVPESPAAPSADSDVAAESVASPLPPRQDDSTAQKTAGGAPDVTAGGPALSDAQPAAPSREAAPPPLTPSATESTTGELIGGMGSASLAPLHSYPQDASPTPTASPGEANRDSDLGTREALPKGGDRPEFFSPDEPSPGAVTGAGGQSNPGATQVPRDVRPPVEEQIDTHSAFSRSRSPLTQPPGWATPGLLATAISIGAGILAGVMMRRWQRRPGSRAQRAARSAQRTLTDTLQVAGGQAHGAVAQAGESATQARRQAARSAKRAARRGRWFRRGLLLGAALGILFAPEPGARLRERLRESASQRFAGGV